MPKLAEPVLKTAQPSPGLDEPEPVIIKKVNTRLLFIALGLVAGLLPAVYLVHAWQMENNADKLKERAQAAEERGEYDKARPLYRKYLNFREDDFDTVLHFLRLEDGMATTQEVLARVLLGYEELLRRDPGRPDEADIRKDIIAIAMTNGEYSLAVQHLETLLKDQAALQKDPDQAAELRFQLAQCHNSEGRIPEAYAGYVEVIEAQPANHKAYHALANLFANHASSLPRQPAIDKNSPPPPPKTLVEKIQALRPEQGKTYENADKAADEILAWMIAEPADPLEAHLLRASYYHFHTKYRLDEARQDVESARTEADGDLRWLLYSVQLGADQARLARFKGQRAAYSPLIRLVQNDVSTGRKVFPDDPRFLLWQSVIEDEVRQGLRWLPALAEKPGQLTQVPAASADPIREAEAAQYQAVVESLREGLDLTATAYEELTTQPPVRLSLRREDKNPPLNRIQLTDLAIQMRWSLADMLISKHILGASDSKASPNTELSLTELKGEVNTQIDELRKLRASTGHMEFLSARLLMAEGEWKKAAWSLEQTRVRLSKNRAIIQRVDSLLDECYARLENPDLRLQTALRGLREDPNWLEAILKLPGLYEKANRADEALRAYERLQKYWPDASLAVARLKLQKELNKPSESRRWDAIHAVLDSASTVSGIDPAELAILRADVYSFESLQFAEQGELETSTQKYNLALEKLNDAIATSPRNAKLRAARGRLELKRPSSEGHSAQKRIQAAAEVLELAYSELGDQLELRLAMVQIASLQPAADALSELSLLEEPAFSNKEQISFLEALVRAYALVSFRAVDQPDKEAALTRAIELSKDVAELQSGEIEPQIELGEMAYGQRDPETLQGAIDYITKIEGPNGPNGNYLKALKLFIGLKTDDSENIKVARDLLTSAIKERSFWATLPRTLGDLEWQLEAPDVAMTHYEKAFALGERDRGMIAKMFEHYYLRQRRNAADEIVKKLALDTPILLSGELARWKWRVDWQMRRFDEAVGVASSFAARSNDYDDHLWESRLRYSQGERGKAVLDPLFKARDLARDKPEPWVAIVEYYSSAGNAKEAKATILEAKKPENLAADPPQSRLLTLGHCYEITGEWAEAERHYLDALKAVKSKSKQDQIQVYAVLADFYSRAKSDDPSQEAQNLANANKYWDLILAPESDAPAKSRELARLRKVDLSLISGRYDETERALELLVKGRKDAYVSDEDLRVEAKIRRLRNRYQDRLALIKILETLAERNTIKLDEKLVLARAYESTDQWPKAQLQFKELNAEVGSETNSVRASLLADYALALLDREDVDEKVMLAEAQSLVQELERLEPKSFRARTTRALLLHRQDRGREAAKLLQEYVQTLNLQAPEQAFRDLVEQQQIDEALDALKMLLDEKSAEQIIDKVRKLVAEGNQEEAVVTLKRYINASDLTVNVQTTLVRVIARFLEKLEQYPAAEETYRHFAERSKQPEAILEVAAFLARRDRIDEALAICESAWKTSDPRLVAKVSVGTLRSAGQPTPAQIQRVESRLTKALEMANSEHWMELITTYADLKDLQGQHAESINVYREILKRNPLNATALNNLAWLLSFQPQARGEAQKLIDQAIKHYGPVGSLLDTRGMIALKRGESGQALKDFNQAALEVPAAAIHFHLTQAHWASGDSEAAEAAFRDAQSKNLDPITDLHVLEADDYQKFVELFK